jgi:hypothetical protein
MVRVFGQNFALEDVIGSHTCSLQANMRVTNGIPLETSRSTALIVAITNFVETLKVRVLGIVRVAIETRADAWVA